MQTVTSLELLQRGDEQVTRLVLAFYPYHIARPGMQGTSQISFPILPASNRRAVQLTLQLPNDFMGQQPRGPTAPQIAIIHGFLLHQHPQPFYNSLVWRYISSVHLLMVSDRFRSARHTSLPTEAPSARLRMASAWRDSWPRLLCIIFVNCHRYGRGICSIIVFTQVSSFRYLLVLTPDLIICGRLSSLRVI